MNTIGSLLLFAVITLSDASSLWSNRRTDSGDSVRPALSAWSGRAPGGTGTRTREIVRRPINGGAGYPSLTETVSRSDPWSRQAVPQKFHNKFMTGRTHYDRFITESRGAVVTSVAGGGGSGLTLLPRDLLFIIDMSGSIHSSDWSLTKQTLADLIERLCGTIGRGPQNNRIAIVTFSSRVVLNFNFTTHWTIASVRQAILSMPQAGGLTCTGDAFVYAHQHMFDPDTGIRSATESVKEVLLLTDGRSNCGAPLAQAASRLKVKAFVFALAVGNFGTSGRREIESMVSRPLIDHIFSVANFIEFRQMMDDILQYPGKCVPFELK